MNRTKIVTQASLERLQDRISEEPLEAVDPQDLASEGDLLEASDPHFKSELNYDGYRSIEESDNGAYNSLDAEHEEDSEEEKELDFEERTVAPDAGEESLIDPQGNRS
jgi:hypothetical protein